MPSGWRVGERAPTTIRLHAGERTDHVYLTGTPDAATAVVEDGESRSLTATLDGRRAGGHAGRTCAPSTSSPPTDGQIWLAGTGRTAVVEEVREAPVRPDDEHSGDAELDQPDAGFGCRRRR